MNRTINPAPGILNKLILAGFVSLTLVQMVLRPQHHSTFLDTWNGPLTIVGFVFSVPRVFPGLVENPFYGLFSFLLRVRSWVPVTLCALLAASLGMDLLLPNTSRTIQPPPTLAARTTPSYPTSASVPGQTSGSTSDTAQTSSSSDSPSATPVPTLSSSGTLVLNDSMANPIPTDPWDVLNQPNAKCSFINETYHVKALPQQVPICKTQGANLSNFIYEMTITIVQGSGFAGMVFRNKGSHPASTNLSSEPLQADVLLFDQQGNYGLAASSLNGKPTMTQTGKCNNFLRGFNQPNQIDVQVQGKTIDVFVNGTYLTSGKDDQLEGGQVGVMLVADDTITEATYSNFTLWKL